MFWWRHSLWVGLSCGWNWGGAKGCGWSPVWAGLGVVGRAMDWGWGYRFGVGLRVVGRVMSWGGVRGCGWSRVGVGPRVVGGAMSWAHHLGHGQGRWGVAKWGVPSGVACCDPTHPLLSFSPPAPPPAAPLSPTRRWSRPTRPSQRWGRPGGPWGGPEEFGGSLPPPAPLTPPCPPQLNGAVVQDVQLKVSIARKQLLLDAATGKSLWGSLGECRAGGKGGGGDMGRAEWGPTGWEG